VRERGGGEWRNDRGEREKGRVTRKANRMTSFQDHQLL